ncbi:MAG: response regulator, partial [Paenibacillus sp.]|nr:response regulator [Paenibacillus sp.]
MDLIKVLMVDDELIVRNWFTNHIPWGDAGVALIGCAANGQLALQLMEQEIPDIVITDITMPVMNGLDFARNVQALYPKVKIVILTVYSEFAYAQQAVSIGAKEFLLKTELTTEQLLECCGRLAQEIHKEKQEEQRLSGRELNDLEEKWLAKREFVQSMLDDELDSEQYLNEIHANYSRRFTRLSCIWIGWDTFPMMFEKHKTSQQLLDLQREIGQGLLTSQGVDCEIHVYPYRNNRLFIVVKGPTSLSDLHYANYMYHLTLSMLSLADKLTGTESFLYMDQGTFELDRFAKRMNSGLDLLQAYFYQPKAAFQVTD